VAVPVTDGTPMFELAAVLEVLASDRSSSTGVPREDWYDVRLAAGERGPMRLDRWGVVDTAGGLEVLADAQTVVVPPPRDGRVDFPADLLEAVQAAHARGARIASVCTGAFVLAAAGLLDGRPAITHWSAVDELARRYPRVDVQRTVLYVDDGDVLTSAGSAAGLDLCLHLVRRDHGSRVAGIVARHSVVPPHRDGGQAQFVPTAAPDLPTSGFAASLDWARRHLDRPVGVEEWARAAGTSPRTFARWFRDALGSTPARWLVRERVRRAQELLEATDLSVEAVAARCGFATAAGLRRPFLRDVGTTPQEYRRTFGAGALAEAAEGRRAGGASSTA
jgi:transcriptional regulator GlxA family with amidase domain